VRMQDKNQDKIIVNIFIYKLEIYKM